MNNQKPRFHYHAHAIALAGEVTHPFNEIIDVQAPATIPSMGGVSSSHRKGYRLRGVLMHHGAHSQTAGRHNLKSNAHEVMAHASVGGLNIEDKLTVDFVTAHLTATYYTNADDYDQEPQISPRGSMFHRLRIAGRNIELEPNVDLYHELDTMVKVRKAYSDNAKFREALDRDAFVGQETILPESHHRFFPWRMHEPDGKLPEYHGHTVVPLFRVLNKNEPGVFEVRGNVVYVPDFGRIHLGELVITSYERRLTMMRADLGSPVNADVMAASGCGGGGPIDSLRRRP
jgi:hypothetical protein